MNSKYKWYTWLNGINGYINGNIYAKSIVRMYISVCLYNSGKIYKSESVNHSVIFDSLQTHGL